MLSRLRVPVWILVLVCLFPFAVETWANPGFARRYDLPCHFCHDGFPKLSVLGERFKERGYRLEDESQPFRLSDWLETVPISVRANISQSFQEQGDATTSGQVRLLSAGNLGKRVSYWADHWFAADEDGAESLGFSNAFLRIDVLEDEFYIKGGRFELDLPFTQLRSPHLTEYGLYFHNSGFEFETLGMPHDGIELGGNLDEDTRWSVAMVRGSEPPDPTQDHDFDLNLFGRLQRRYGERRAGAFLFWGKNELTRNLEMSTLPDGTDSLRWREDIVRGGIDLAWYLRDLHLYGAFMVGLNDNPIADAEFPNGTKRATTFASGFVVADYSFRDPLTLSMRVELSERPETPLETNNVGWIDVYPGLKIWLNSQLRLVMEFGFRNRDRPTVGIVIAEIVF